MCFSPYLGTSCFGKILCKVDLPKAIEFTDKAPKIGPWTHTGRNIRHKHCSTFYHAYNKDLGRGACITIGYHVRGWAEKVSTQAQGDPAVTLSWRWFETGCSSQQFIRMGSPPVAPQCTTFLNFLFPAVIMTMGFLQHCPSPVPTRKCDHHVHGSLVNSLLGGAELCSGPFTTINPYHPDSARLHTHNCTAHGLGVHPGCASHIYCWC